MILIVGSKKPETAKFAALNNLGNSTLYQGQITDSDIYHTSIADCPNLEDSLNLFDKIYWANSKESEFENTNEFVETLYLLKKHGGVIGIHDDINKKYKVQLDIGSLSEYSSKELNRIKLDNHIFTTLWDTKEFSIGDGFISPDKKYFIFKIAKNASTFLSQNLLLLNWEIANYKDYKESNVKTIVILREPISRWVSGISEYLYIYHYEAIKSIVDPLIFECFPLLGEKLGLSIILREIIFDDHTERQCSFLENVNINETIWIKFDKDLNKNLSFLLDSIGIKNNLLNADRVNSKEKLNYDALLKKKLQELFTHIVSIEKFKVHLEEKMWCDIELYNKVKFYNIE
jgi:hypothetical protein